MKKLIFTFGLFFSLAGVTKAQNSMTVEMNSGICIDVFTANYTDRSSESLALGCDGTYSYNIGSKTVSAIVVNGVVCREGSTAVRIGANTVTVTALHDEAKGPFSNIVVR